MKRGKSNFLTGVIATFTLSGTILGAGILGLPYVFSKSGYAIGVFWIIFLGIFLIWTKLYLGEITLRTKTKHHLTGYAEKYLGKTGKKIMFFALIFGMYSALLAYLIGQGTSLSYLFFGNVKYALYFGLGFWVLLSLIIRGGFTNFKKVELWGVDAVIIVMLIIVVYYFPQVNIENLKHTNFEQFFFPLGVTFFALLGFSAIPEMRRIDNSEKIMKKAIIIGSLIPIAIYIIFTLVFVGVLGKNIPEIATLSFGKLVIILGCLTMLTSYCSLSFSLRDVFFLDYGIKKEKAYYIVILAPLILFLSLFGLNFVSFIEVIGVAGGVSGGITGIMILFMNKKAKLIGERKPEFSIPINKIVIWILSIIFIGAVIAQLFLG